MESRNEYNNEESAVKDDREAETARLVNALSSETPFERKMRVAEFVLSTLTTAAVFAAGYFALTLISDAVKERPIKSVPVVQTPATKKQEETQEPATEQEPVPLQETTQDPPQETETIKASQKPKETTSPRVGKKKERSTTFNRLVTPEYKEL